MPAHPSIFGRRQASKAAISRRAVLPVAAALRSSPGRSPLGPRPSRPGSPTPLLLDASTGAVLFEKRADAPVAPESTTKILTAEIVFREIAQGRLSLSTRMAISPRAAREGDAKSGGSSMLAQAGQQISVDDLLRGMLILSGNDAAIALAEGIAGSESAFAARMNEEARASG